MITKSNKICDFYYNGSNKDFYEPRVEDRFLVEPANYGAKLGFDHPNFINKQFSEKKYETTLRLRTRYRVTDKSFKSTSDLKVQMMKLDIYKKAMTIFILASEMLNPLKTQFK